MYEVWKDDKIKIHKIIIITVNVTNFSIGIYCIGNIVLASLRFIAKQKGTDN